MIGIVHSVSFGIKALIETEDIMSGPKAYTMREMKGIVEYLVEHKAYGELKGRKMWMDYANSSLTTRTWQSLKETFLKRILPDVQNPYYQLTRDQVASFKQGYDIAEKEKKNRLEIQRSSEERSSEAEKQKNSKQPLVTQTASTSAEKPNEVDKSAGEDFQSGKISARNRSSADTLIIGEDNHRQSNDNLTEDLEADPKAPSITMKDRLVFKEGEPSSIVQAVLADFRSDSEESETLAPIEMKGESSNKDANQNNANDQEAIVIAPEEDENDVMEHDDLLIIDGVKKVGEGPSFISEIITEVSPNDLVNWLNECGEEKQTEVNKDKETGNTTNVSNEAVTSSANEGSVLVVEDSEPIVIEDNSESAENLNQESIENDNNNQNSLSTTNDTIIPNNQELLNNKVDKTNGISKEALHKEVATRKRSSSQENTENKKKKQNNSPQKPNGDIEATPASSNNTEALFEAIKNAETTVGNTQKTQDAPANVESHENPCLNSVSLFEEQFNTTKYIDSEDEETPIPKNSVKQPEESTVTNDVSRKLNQKVEFVTNNKSNEPRPEEVVIVKTKSPTQNKEAIESQGNQMKIDLTLIEQDNVSMLKKRQLNKKEIILLETDNETAPYTRKTRKIKNTLILSSNSDSDEVERVHENNKERYKHLSHAFGFVPGTSRTAQRRRSFQNRRIRLRTTSRGQHENSDEDDYTDIDDAEAFVSPPHGRRNRRGRMYKRPETGRIVAVEEEGRLFVILGKKVYPLVSDAKELNYVHYDASDHEEESIWRQKYIVQKKKATELKKQIEQAKSEASSSRPRSPIPSSISLRNDGGTPKVAATSDNKNNAMNIVQSDAGKIQITLSNNNEEKINLEGHWPQVLPIMQQVMSMFYKSDNPTAVKEKPKDNIVPNVQVQEDRGDDIVPNVQVQKAISDNIVPNVQVEEDISGRATTIIPIDIDTRKVEDIEREIFQEIEERGILVDIDVPEKISNVTKRKARAPSNNSEKSVKPDKIARKSNEGVDAKPELNPTDDKTKITESKTQDKPKKRSIPLSISDTPSPSKDNVATKSTATNKAKKIEAEDENKIKDGDKMGDKKNTKIAKTNLPPIEPRVTRKLSRKSVNDTEAFSPSLGTRGRKPNTSSKAEQVRYMLPPGPKTRKSTAKLTPNKAESPENPHEISQDRFGNSVDSTQGYQDSDASPMKNITKRKKKLSLVVKKGKHYRRKSFPSLSVDELSLDSSNSSYFVPIKSFSHPTLDSEIYKTDSYRILMGGRKLSVTKLDAIEESSKIDDVGHCNVSKKSNDSLVIEVGTGSSSIVSLPFSPELSVVENLSISREMLQNISHPTINEHQANDSVVSNLYNQYLIANVDISVPLMQQDCELLDKPKEKTAKKVKKPKAPAKSPIKVSDLLNKVSSANLSLNNTLSDTLDQRLRNLLLESAKKITNTSKENLMEVDEPTETKKGGKKRCSTPRKRITKKSKATVDSVIDEHRESFAKAGRQSCPPLSTFVPLDENANNSADVQLKPKKPARVKKDIIKVKIQKPTKAREVTDRNSSQASIYTDSGINESVSINGMFHGNDNVELIHNHSETCLQAHECIGNSIEFVEESKSSVISIHSTESLQNELDEAMKDIGESFEEQESPSVECESAHNCSEDIFTTPATTTYHSPIDHPNSSLLTEDLSDEISSPSRKWYLLSEEETNTCSYKPEEMTSNMRSSNYLQQIFPIACAVPDLSTISEMSKENEDSRKTLGEDTRSSGGRN